MTSAAPFVDLACDESVHAPAGYFARVREGGDVQWSEAQNGWAILSHGGCEAAFREGDLLSSDRTGPFARAAARHSEAFGVVVDVLSGWMNFRDPPVHTRLREPVKSAFTPRAVGALEAPIETIVGQALDALDGDLVDLHEAFARPIPALVIAALLGVTGEDRHRFEGWSDDLSTIVFATEPRSVDEGPVVAAANEFVAYFGALIERERAEPTGSILTMLVERASDELSAIELVGACTLLLFGGHETTTTLLGNTLAMLLDDAELRGWFRAHPEAWGTAVDEFMRVAGPSRSMPRKVARDHVRGGVEMRKGQTAYLAIVSANHDGEVFRDPGRFDALRDPNPHLGFGWGLHYCLGANLARLEARIALRMLFERCPDLSAAGPVPPMHASAMGFGRRPLLARVR